jgi:hypothetical protein
MKSTYQKPIENQHSHDKKKDTRNQPIIIFRLQTHNQLAAQSAFNSKVVITPTPFRG